MLTIISTPIGNLKDVSFRAFEELKKAENVLCEDTRRAKKLFLGLKINFKSKRFIVYNDLNKERLLKKINLNKDYVLISDNGTPAINDPGYKLINHFIENKIKITHIPGPSAFLSALVLSGFPTDKFSYQGFLPKSRKQIVEKINRVLSRKETTIFYESPHRIIKTLNIIKENFCSLKICIARELTKRFEEIIIGTAQEILAEHKELKGEMSLVIDGRSSIKKETSVKIKNEELKELYSVLKKFHDKSDAFSYLIKLTGYSKNELFNMLHKNPSN